MKTLILLILIFSLPITLSCQKIKIENLLLIKPVFVTKFNEFKNEPNTVLLKMNFNSPEILNPDDLSLIKDASILKVELYYTAFQISESFSQPLLNKQRFANLQNKFPQLFNQSFVTWEIKAQNDCKNEKVAKEYFHGFVITYKSLPVKEETIKEIASIKKITKSDSLGYDSVYTVYQKRTKKIKEKTGYYVPTSKSKKAKGITYITNGIFNNRKKQYTIRIDTIKVGKTYSKFIKDKNAISFVKRNLKDTSIFAVLRRHQNWEDITVVCDVTGSMSAYTTQLLVWYKLHCMSNKINHFTFFNDGDSKPDKQKLIGKTGGIYNVNAGNYEAVEIMIEKAMTAGSGGDSPENNCEALINAIKNTPNAKEYVMIADNFANIKDIKLIKEINKPIHIIICGTNNIIVNTDYLDLALSTKGSIHSIEQDIENLTLINEGSIITFNHVKFKLQNGKFIRLIEM